MSDCKGCSLRVCHTHHPTHIPGCWACVINGEHRQCTCDKALRKQAGLRGTSVKEKGE